MGLLMQQDICSVMYCRRHCFLFRLGSSGYTFRCSHTQIKGLGICTFSWHMHWTGSPPLEQSVLLWLLFLFFLNRLWYQDVWLFLLFEEWTLFACVLHPLELPSHWLFVGCWCNLSLGVVWLGFCRLYHLQCRMQLWGYSSCLVCNMPFHIIGLVYEEHQSRCYSFQGLVMTPASCIARFAGSSCSHSGCEKCTIAMVTKLGGA